MMLVTLLLFCSLLYCCVFERKFKSFAFYFTGVALKDEIRSTVEALTGTLLGYATVFVQLLPRLLLFIYCQEPMTLLIQQTIQNMIGALLIGAL